MRIEMDTFVPPGLADEMWRLYTDAFEELRCTAVQRHVMDRADFDGLMRDRRVVKYRAVDPAGDGGACALATLTNDLDAVPLVSPEYFQRRWPAHFAEGRIWYVGFVAIHPRHRGTGVFDDVVLAMCRVVSARRGVAVLDVCRRNEEIYALPQAIHRLLAHRSGAVATEREDTQSYWSYEFPATP